MLRCWCGWAFFQLGHSDCVRPHPRHQPVRPSNKHRSIHGDFIGLANFDGKVCQLVNRCEARADRVAINSLPADHADNRRVCFRPNPPDVQVRNPNIAERLDQFTHLVRYMIIGRIQQHAGSVAHQCP